LVNNAGIYPRNTTATTDEKTFDQVYAVNVKAPFFLTAAVAPAMAEAGSGAVINLGSWTARLGIPRPLQIHQGSPGNPDPGLGGGVRAAGRPGERDLAGRRGDARPRGGIHPGEVMMKGTPAGRAGTPDAIANAAVYLASDESAFVHGTVLDVDGGRTTVAVIAG
jgi:NAD(P)-dependent dehydrogenase (short-subunit alcohol dehydrogenase family)